MTWEHSKGYYPMIKTAQRFSEIYLHIKIEWTKRPLQGFAVEHIDKLVAKCNLPVIDQPWAGYNSDTRIIIPLNKY
jgi:multiple sugar transport system substrate-binding protein